LSFIRLDATSVNFFRLDLEYLKTITCGTYKLSFASGYISEHLSEDSDYKVSIY